MRWFPLWTASLVGTASRYDRLVYYKSRVQFALGRLQQNTLSRAFSSWTSLLHSKRLKIDQVYFLEKIKQKMFTADQKGSRILEEFNFSECVSWMEGKCNIQNRSKKYCCFQWWVFSLRFATNATFSWKEFSTKSCSLLFPPGLVFSTKWKLLEKENRKHLPSSWTGSLIHSTQTTKCSRYLYMSFNRWKTYKTEKQDLKQKLAVVLRRFQNSALYHSFQGWYTVCNDRSRNRNIIQQCLAKLRMALVLSSFQQWKKSASESRSYKTKAQQIIFRMQNGALSRSFSSWKFFSAQKTHLR